MAALGALLSLAAQAQSNTLQEIEKYRAQLLDGNPADLWEARGEDLWKKRRGPKNVSLEACDIGLGAGVVTGAYVHLPRYFADSDKVEDLESRLVTCMVSLHGFTPEQAKRQPFGDGEKRSDMEALVAYVTAASRGAKMDVKLDHPKERTAYEIGRQMFFFRGGPHDFSCATCHSADGLRIRLQELPNLLKRSDAQRAYASWPAYRVSQGELRSMQWRLYDCYRQQRFPELEFVSEGSIALLTYLAYANGGTFIAPAIKR